MSKMRLFTGFWILLTISVHYGQCCGPAEIGKEYTITSTANVSSGDKVEWIFFYSEVVVYDSTNATDPNTFPDLYIGSTTQITVLNVTAGDESEVFDHYVNGAKVYSCRFYPYKKASKPTCGTLRLQENHLIVTCTTDEVYRRAQCDFTLECGPDKRAIKYFHSRTSYITHDSIYPNESKKTYYSTSCTLKYPVDGLKAGKWTVQVYMYPIYYTDLGTYGYADETLNLAIPTVNIDHTTCPKGFVGEGDTNVRNGFIRQGGRASCLCTRAYAGNPPGTVGWHSTQRANFVVLFQRDDEAMIEIKSPDTFTCRSSSVLDGSHNMTYTPKYAYGPHEVTMSFEVENLDRQAIQNDSVTLCASEGVELTVICAVKQSNVQPGLAFDDFTLIKPSGFSIKQANLKTSGEGYIYTVKLNVTSVGKHILVCEARNPIFTDIKQTNSIAVELRESPSDPPRISVRSSQHGDTLMEGDDVTVFCTVSDGTPYIQAVTLTCSQSQSVTNNGTYARLVLPFVQLQYDQTNCTCEAIHVTGCYDLTGVLTLTVLPNNPDEAGVQDENQSPFTTADIIGATIGVFVGTLVLVAAIALTVFYVRRGKLKGKNRNKKPDYDVPVIENQPRHYVNVSLKKDAPNYLTINPPDQTPRSDYDVPVIENQPNHYVNVSLKEDAPNYLTINPPDQTPRSETNKRETKTEHVYNNQAFVRKTESTDPEGNVYSVIDQSD